MISALSIEELNHGTGKVHNGPAIAAAVLQALLARTPNLVLMKQL